MQKEIKILVVEPNKNPEVKTIKNDVHEMQRLVEGFIECVYPFDNSLITLVCNEEGKLEGLAPNRRIGNDIIVGTFFISKDDLRGNFKSLSDKEIETYSKMFAIE